MTVSTADRWRCFVGVPLSDEIREPLRRRVDAWRSELDARWTDPAGWHCSLHFIGDVDASRVGALGTALADAVGSRPRFTVHTGGLGAFPSASRARVLYYGIEDADGRLRQLAAAAAAVRSAGGNRADPSFRAHVTLARLRRPASVEAWLEGRRAPAGRLDVAEACLMRSRLGTGPARYDRLACFPLAEAVA